MLQRENKFKSMFFDLFIVIYSKSLTTFCNIKSIFTLEFQVSSSLEDPVLAGKLNEVMTVQQI